MQNCILYVKSIDGEGLPHNRDYNRTARFWTNHAACAEGYRSFPVAQGQLTRLERKGFKLPLGETLFEWGIFDANHRNYKDGVTTP